MPGPTAWVHASVDVPARQHDGERARAQLDPGTDDLDAEVARVRALGARVPWPGQGSVAPADPVGLPPRGTRDDPDR